MLRLRDVPADELSAALREGKFRLQIGQFLLKVTSPIPDFTAALIVLYGSYPISIDGGPYLYDIEIGPPSAIRRWYRRNAVYRISGDTPFLPIKADHAHALFEWSLNWTFGSYAHQFLMLHSAVVELNDRGLLLAATSGSGKSTLAAELCLSGWRLLSDEMTLIDKDLQLVPCARPISLKNQSLDVIKKRHPHVVLGPRALDTHKGTIAHLPAPESSVDRNSEIARPSLIVFPKWTPNAQLRVLPVGSGQAALRLIDQSFNYPVLGQDGFERLTDLVTSAQAWEIEYSSLDQAKEVLTQMLLEHD